jgi:hypothetical protein
MTFSMPTHGLQDCEMVRLRLAADEPFAVETCYLPADEVPGLNRNAIARGSLFSILEGTYGIGIAYAEVVRLSPPSTSRSMFGVPTSRRRGQGEVDRSANSVLLPLQNLTI